MKEENQKRLFSNDCSEEELHEIADWLQKEKVSLKGWSWFKNYWNGLDIKADTPELSGTNLLDKIHHQINLKMNAAGGSLEKTKKGKSA